MPPHSDELVAWLRDHGTLADVHGVARDAAWMNKHSVAAVAVGTVLIDGEVCALEIRIHRDFPARLPKICVDLASSFAALPHVEDTGVVCYRDPDDAMVDVGRPADIVRDAVALAVETLRTGRSPDASLEYANEIVAYWRHSFSVPTYISLVEPGDDPRLVKSFQDRRGVRVQAASHADLAAFSATRQAGGQAVNALYVPIDLPAAHGFHPKELVTRTGFITHVLPILRRSPRRWRRFCGRCRAAGIDVLLGVRRSLGRRGLVGIRIESRSPTNTSLLLELDRCTFTPFHVDPGDRGYVVPRGGASDALWDKKVLLVGCGSVGGHVALGLARSGIGRLDLVDPDVFELANTHRHICGRAYWGHPKSDGLKQEIERLVPYVDVRSRPSNVLDLLAREPALFLDYDLVISAIGAPMVERRINEVIVNSPGAPPALFAWLEPLGIGGHVLAVNVAGRHRGCFECLYAHDDEIYSCRAAFAAPGAVYSRDAMGCGGRHVPFSDLDANRLAVAVVQRGLGVLAGVKADGLHSLKGSADAFRDAGFWTTARYAEPGPELTLSSEVLSRSDCAVCGS